MYRQCSKCVMDTTASEITFNPRGVCNFCLEFAQADWKRIHEIEHLPALIESIKKEKGEYDVLIGLSGGVDSSTALTHVIELGLKPLCFTVDNGWNTVQADENIMRLVEGLKVPFERHALDLEKFKELQEAFLKSGTINVEIPTDHCLMAKTYELAAKYKIKWIISGGNVATEGIMPKGWGHQARDLRFIKGIYKRFFGKPLANSLPQISISKYLLLRFWKNIRIVNLLDYYQYNRDESIKMLTERFGYKPYGDKHGESIFTWWFQNYYLITKFNIDKRKAHYSSMINSKQMTRQDALLLLQQPLTYPQLSWDSYAKDGNRKSYHAYPNSEFWWALLSKVYSIWKS